MEELPRHPPRFIADVHLGRLARYLRMLGFDTLYETGYSLEDQVTLAMPVNRIMLSRNPLLYKRSNGMPYCIVGPEDPKAQLRQLMQDLELRTFIRPFVRCMACNGPIHGVDKAEVEGRLLPNTREGYHEFWRCGDCQRVYWKGPHYERMQRLIEGLL